MSTPADAVFGQANASSDAGLYNSINFLITAALAKVQTISIVKVLSCTNSGGVAAAGTVTVQVLVNIMTGAGTPVAHGAIYDLPYSRLQGGVNAVIMDPNEGDIGIAGFTSRDSSGVINNKAAANPGSLRMFDWADGLYLGGLLNGTPTNYLQFMGNNITLFGTGEITIQAATTVTVQAPVINLVGEVTIDGSLTMSTTGGATGDITTPGTIAGATDVTSGSISLKTHKHPVVGIQTGSSTIDTGDPI